MKNTTYTNGEITVTWDKNTCIHSGNCVRGLLAVFNPKAKPWVNMEGASTNEIAKAVKNCPSAALKLEWNKKMIPESKRGKEGETLIKIIQDGPIMVAGDFSVINSDGKELEKKDKAFFCRCGNSGNKPFCDGTHKRPGFKG